MWMLLTQDGDVTTGGITRPRAAASRELSAVVIGVDRTVASTYDPVCRVRSRDLISRDGANHQRPVLVR